VKNPIAFALNDQEKVLEPLARAAEAGFTGAARSGLHSTASATCTKIEPASVQELAKSGTVGLETRFDAAINGRVLLLVPRNDLAHLGGLLSGMECSAEEPVAPEILEACVDFFAQGLDGWSKNFAQSCGLPIHCAAPVVINGDGGANAIVGLAPSYNNARGLTFTFAVENHPDASIILLLQSEVIASLNAQLPHYGARSGQSDNGSQEKVQSKWNIDLILDVELEVAVSFGETEMLLKDILKLGVGSVIELEKGVNDPVSILVNEKPIASGEVVIVDGNYGVKVLEVESTAERIRSLA
jgi:flagellar motor switch protein FliN/FliY